MSDEKLAQSAAIQRRGPTRVFIKCLCELLKRRPVEWRVPFNADHLAIELPYWTGQKVMAWGQEHPRLVLLPWNRLEPIKYTFLEAAQRTIQKPLHPSN